MIEPIGSLKNPLPITRIFYLSRRANGTCMLTKLTPVKERRYGTREDELYVAYGEPMATQNLCLRGTMALFGFVPEPLEWVLVELTGRVIE